VNLFRVFADGVLIGVRCAVHLMAFMSNPSLPHCLFLVFLFVYMCTVVLLFAPSQAC